jgi:methylated-DNA-protein-cysteine methyltransferase related protein
MKENRFFPDVYEVVKLIPFGRVTTYGAIARYLGATRSARLVGWAMNQSHGQKVVPAHRVVNRNGLLTGKMHFGNPDEMQKKLEAEGIRVENNRIVDFEHVFWDPSRELNLF